MTKEKFPPEAASGSLTDTPEPVLSGAWMARLAAALEPILPPAARVAVLRERLLAAAAAEPRSHEATRRESGNVASPRPSTPARQHMTLRADEGRWLKLTEGIEMKPLHREHGTLSYLLRLGPGMALPEHDHPENEECLVLDGDVWLGDTHAFAGDYHLAREGIPHGRIYTEGGCLLFLRGARPEMPRVVR
jgi:anti-sigma factor ChrR (cupin superfamily)